MKETRFRKLEGRKVQYLDASGKWKSTGMETITEAKQWYYSGRGRDVVTFADVANTLMSDRSEGSYLNMLDSLDRNNCEAYTNQSNSIIHLHLIPEFGNMPIDEITTINIQDWYSSLRKPDGTKYSNGYTNTMLNAMSTVFKWAMIRGITDHNPVKNVMKRSVGTEGRMPFSKSELNIMLPEDTDRLVQIYGSKKVACYFMILRDTGWRPGEILGLTPFDIIRSEKAITTSKTYNTFEKKIKQSIKTTKKGAKFKVGILSDFTYSLLMDITSGMGYDENIFRRDNGTMYNAEIMNYRFKVTMEKLGISTEGRPQYSMRTTFMTNVAKRMDTDNVMLLMGHKQWRSCYDKRTPEDIVKKIKGQ